MESIVLVGDMVEFSELKDVFEEIVAPELVDISNYSKLV